MNHHKKETKIERRKIEGMNQFGFYIWKCHSEILCMDILNKNVVFTKMKYRKVKQVLSGG
jgi:hypothetical protein